MAILPDRDGAQGSLVGNLTNAQANWYVDASRGDLHLVRAAAAAIDVAAPLVDVLDDFDGETRPIGLAPDVGADEYAVSPPAAVIDLRVTAAFTDTGRLTANLQWSVPTDAVTITLRFAGGLITEDNWPVASILTDALPGGSEALVATVPFEGSTVYFALKSRNSGGDWSSLSNSAFWPYWDVFLPVLTREG
jgi:hypothetical protein